MSTLNNNWQEFFSSNGLLAFEAVALQSPLLTNLLNGFGGSISLSSGATYFDQGANTIYIGTDYTSESTQDGFAQLAVALAHELGHAEVQGGTASTITASSVSTAIQLGLDSEGVAGATEFVVASQLGSTPARKSATAMGMARRSRLGRRGRRNSRPSNRYSRRVVP